MNLYELEKNSPKGPLVFGEESNTAFMGIDLPDGRVLILDCCSEKDEAFLRLLVHRYNNFRTLFNLLYQAKQKLKSFTVPGEQYSGPKEPEYPLHLEIEWVLRELEDVDI